MKDIDIFKNALENLKRKLPDYQNALGQGLYNCSLDEAKQRRLDQIEKLDTLLADIHDLEKIINRYENNERTSTSN